MQFKKMMIGILAMSLILTAFVVLMVHNTKGPEPKALEIKEDSPFIGVWLVPGENDKKSMDYMEFDLKKDGTLAGNVGKYDLEGSWEPTSDTHINIKNDKGDIAYEGNLKKGELYISGKAVTDSSSWKLTKKDSE